MVCANSSGTVYYAQRFQSSNTEHGTVWICANYCMLYDHLACYNYVQVELEQMQCCLRALPVV